MSKSLTSLLYDGSRMLGKAASTLYDIKTVASGDPEKIAKRFVRKSINKTGNKLIRNITKKVR